MVGVLLVYGIIGVVGGIIAAEMADNKGKNRALWFVLSLVISPLVTILILAVMDKPREGSASVSDRPDSSRSGGVSRSEEDRSSDDVLTRLERLNDLRKDGALTEEEFEAEKDRILSSVE